MAIIALAFFLLCIHTARAISIRFNSPIFVQAEKNFTVMVAIENADVGSYDLKAEVLDSNGNRISRMFYDGKWRSTFYYAKNAIVIPEKNSTQIVLKIEDYVGNATLILKIRKIGTTKILAEENHSIVVEAGEKLGKASNEEIKEKSNGMEEEKKEIDEKNKDKALPTKRDNEEKEKSKNTGEKKQKKKKIVKAGNVIKLGQNKPGKTGNVVYEAGSEKIKRHAIHWFIAFLLFVLVMMAKRKI